MFALFLRLILQVYSYTIVDSYFNDNVIKSEGMESIFIYQKVGVFIIKKIRVDHWWIYATIRNYLVTSINKMP